VTNILEGIRGQYNTNAILTNAKVGISDPMDSVTDTNLGIKSKNIDFQEMLAVAKNGTRWQLRIV
jgi:hypothetical protein